MKEFVVFTLLVAALFCYMVGNSSNLKAEQTDAAVKQVSVEQNASLDAVDNLCSIPNTGLLCP